MGEGKIRLVLVDDHPILRQGLRALLELEADIVVVGEAGDAEEACNVVGRTEPDLVISDIGLTESSGIDLIAQLRRVLPQLRILMLSAHCSEEYIRASFAAQADGYILKDSSRAELLVGIRKVARGERYLCSAIEERVLGSFVRGHAKAVDPLRHITDREKEVLTLVASGMSNKQIARQLDLSTKTVEKHRSNLMRKLSLHNTAAITMFAVQHGLVKAAAPGVAELPQSDQ
ncbi:MAG: response regulator transcription factor [Steroidobacteraceae bacterium]